MKNKFSLLLGLLVLACSGGSDDGEEINNSCPLTGIETGECPTGDFSTLVWQDEFDGNPWVHHLALCYWGRLSRYCGWKMNNSITPRPSNVQVQNGFKNHCRRENYEKDFTSLVCRSFWVPIWRWRSAQNSWGTRHTAGTLVAWKQYRYRVGLPVVKSIMVQGWIRFFSAFIGKTWWNRFVRGTNHEKEASAFHVYRMDWTKIELNFL